MIAIIGILVALLLPAVQAAREAARRTQCKNNLKQLALACLLHVDTQKYLPSGGWNDHYTANPSRGFGGKQPGSWCFSVLPYLEESSVRDLGNGQTGANFTTAMQKVYQTPITAFMCPSRRQAKLYPRIGTEGPEIAPLTFDIKGDYAANDGDSQNSAGDGFGGIQFGPTAGLSYATIDASPSSFTDATCIVTTTRQGTGVGPYCQTAVIGYHSEVKLSQITDGTTGTYLIGEKFLQPIQYDDIPTVGGTPNVGTPTTGGYGDNQSVYTGFEWDNERVVWNLQLNPTDGSQWQPRQDTNGEDNPAYLAFGSAHAGGLNMAMCDGSVHTISYDIDPNTHRYLGIKNDGNTAAPE